MKITEKMQKFLDEIVYPVNPNFKIKNKANKNGLYAFLSFFGKIFNPTIDEKYITIVAGDCWFPASYFDSNGNFREDHSESAIETLAHETLHEYDRKRITTFPYFLLYAFPQILAIFSLGAIGAIWNSWWLLCLLFLLFLVPIPAPGRAWSEIRGYRVNVMIGRLKNDMNIQGYIEWVADKQFCSSSYYFMFPFRGYVIRKLLETEYEKEDMYLKIKDWFLKNKN